jgi:hypothetical protein
MIVAHTPLPQTGIPTLFDNRGSDKRKRESAVPCKHIEPIRRDNRHRMEWSFGFTSSDRLVPSGTLGVMIIAWML